LPGFKTEKEKMGTRSTVKFYDHNDKEPVAAIYQQYDGYITGVGHNLAKWLADKKIINGISGQKMEQGFANGMSCLAAQYIAEHKTKIGSFYMTTANDEQEYNYEVRYANSGFIIKVGSFEGTLDELLNYQENESEDTF
jgi:hypothetical protein